MSVSPSPVPFCGWLLVTLKMLQVALGGATVTAMSTILWFGGQSRPGFRLTVKTGGGAATTVTSKESVAVLPRVSLAVHVTVVVPMRNIDPDGGVQVTSRARSTM